MKKSIFLNRVATSPKNLMKKLFLLLIVTSVIPTSAFAQHATIVGKVLDNENATLESATVELYDADSIWVAGSLSDKNGIFRLTNLETGNYVLKISFVGFAPNIMKINNLIKKLDIGSVSLVPDNQLGEVLVTASNKRYDIDKQILIPTISQREISNNGWTLMRNMQLSRIRLNPVTNEISTSGGQSVILQINGRNVEKEEITTLLPHDIVRIEYIDQPGVRYQAGAVINYIVKYHQAGGSIYADGNQTLSSQGIRRYNANGNYNRLKSQLGFTVSYDESRARWTRENKYHYVLPDYAFDRTEEGLPTIYKDRTLKLSARYTLYDADKYLFNVTLKDKINNVPNQFSDRQGYVTDSYTGSHSFMQDFSTWRSHTPSLDLYFHRKLANSQSLTFNVVGTMIDSKSTHSYMEYVEGGEMLSSINSLIDGTKYSLIAEGIYEKKFKNSKWSAGAHHSQSYTKNRYAGDVGKDVSLKNINSYLFIEYACSFGQFNLNAEMSGKYIRYSQQGKISEKLYAEPRLQLQYSFTDKTLLRYIGRFSSSSPSLSDLNDTEQQMDIWQIRRGNPHLRAYTTYRQNLLFATNHALADWEIEVRYDYADNPIMTSLFYDNNKIVNMKENQGSKHRLTVESTLTLRPFGKYVSLSVTPGINRYIINGHLYAHTYTNWYLRTTLLASYKRWFMNVGVSTRCNDMDGEEINYMEAFHDMGIGYNAKRWNLSAGIMLPFTKEYSQASRNVSDMAASYSKVFTRDLSCMFFLSASVNFDFGKTFKVQKQKRNHSDDDSGILSTGKVGM
mgnify:FL=1